MYTMQRFWEKVDKSGDCWVWTASTRPSGTRHYGRIKVSGRDQLAHRVAYELEVGPIPDGLTIDHLCKNTLCVRPSHLEAVTLAENIRRGTSANGTKSHCANGHPFEGENVYTRGSTRECRACHRARVGGRDPKKERVGSDRRRSKVSV